MKSKYFERGLALFAAIVILTGVTSAANGALGGDFGTIEIHGSAHI